VEMLLRRVANIDSSLLLTGESGVGKEVAAKFVHKISTRAADPFIAVNSAAIPSELVESELFGHEKGAFTGAQARHQGYVERARNGVLFLDEVGELPLPIQAKLLRLIEDRAFTRVGGEAAIKTSARLICATNADIERAVAEGRFRGDLYYRMNVISVVIPPLRDRRDDILQLAQQFIQEFAEAFARDVHGFTASAEEALLEHPWRGNVRELRNRIERAVALADQPWIGVKALFPSEPAEAISGEDRFRTLAEVRDRAERDHIRAVLARVSGRAQETAKLLGVSRRTLFEKMRKLNIRSDI
jgi:DNA-binding NtrC family response regulator